LHYVPRGDGYEYIEVCSTQVYVDIEHFAYDGYEWYSIRTCADIQQFLSVCIEFEMQRSSIKCGINSEDGRNEIPVLYLSVGTVLDGIADELGQAGISVGSFSQKDVGIVWQLSGAISFQPLLIAAYDDMYLCRTAVDIDSLVCTLFDRAVLYWAGQYTGKKVSGRLGYTVGRGKPEE